MDNSVTIIQQLQKANTALKAKNKNLEECLSIVAHDLRNPLNTAMLANELGNKQTVQESLECLNQIIERLLSAPKLEGENFQLALKPFDLKKFLQNFSVTQRPLIEKEKIQFTFEDELPAEQSSITADKTHLQQVLENLIINALRFTPKDSSGKIWCEDAPECGAKFVVEISR